MASLRRSTALPNDATTAKFLYTILKQLDHKSIDWSTVAAELDITNGHAARMRFSRFKQHMEGVAPTSRKPRAEPHTQRKAKLDKRRKRTEQGKGQGRADSDGDRSGYVEGAGNMGFEDMDAKLQSGVKVEMGDEGVLEDTAEAQMTGIGISAGRDHGMTDGFDSTYAQGADYGNQFPSLTTWQERDIKQEPAVKTEDDVYMA